MYVKVFSRGTGKSGGIDYLTNDIDADGNVRSVDPLVIRGNPELTKALIDATNFAQRYTSGVLSFEEKNLDDKAKQKIMDSFEQEAIFPGMEPGQYNSLWVEHRDKGRLELHFVFPNQELTTGKRVAPYYHRADMPRVDNWQEVTNYDHGLSSPKEPERKQTITLDKNLPPKKAEAIRHINSNIERMIQAGTIANRDDIITVLKSAGLEISRVTEKAVSIKNPTDGKQNIRLKGAYYDQSFSSVAELGKNFQRASDDYKRDLSANIERAREKLADQVIKKSEYHEKRYRPSITAVREEPSRKIEPSFDEIRQNVERDRAQTGENRKEIPAHTKPPQMELVETAHNGVSAGNGHRRIELGNIGLPNESNSEPGRGNTKTGIRFNSIPEVGELEPLWQKAASLHSDRPISAGLSGWIQDLKNSVRTGYDRAREKINGWIEHAGETIRTGLQHFESADQQLVTAGAGLEYSKRETHYAIQSNSHAIERGIAKVRENRLDELEQFKTQISLPSYMAQQGYELSRHESSRASVVMRKENEKLVITTDQDGHGVYFNVHDANDNGSIIDFVQRRQHLNLGQVRKELRPQIGREIENKTYYKPQSSTKNLQKISYDLAGMESTTTHPYLESRGISSAIMGEDRFHGTIRIDGRGNAVFPHYDRAGLVGFEAKNSGFTGFSKGGEKGLWHTNNLTKAREIIIVESAIDALSHAERYQDEGKAAYVSIGGQLSDKQLESLQSLLESSARRQQVVTLGTDNDKAGNILAEKIRAMAPEELETRREFPDHGKDWNEDLQEQQKNNRDYGLGMGR